MTMGKTFRRTQQGMTLLSFIIVLAVVGFFLFVGAKLFPMYEGYYSVKQALKQMAATPGVANMDPARVEDLFFRKLYISYADEVKPENVKVERAEDGTGWHMVVDYEVRKPLVYNLDIVGKFHAEENLARGGVDGN
jgi:hypothetical protein